MTDPTPIAERYDFTEVTEGTLAGQGLFDLLMASTKVHLEEEFTGDRIRGKEYAEVYLGGIQAVLSNTIQYLVGNALTKEQRLKLENENDLISAEIEKTQVEIVKTQAEITLLTTQNLNENYKYTYLLPLEKELLSANVTKVSAEIALLNAQINDANYRIANLYPKEVEKANAEIALINARVLSESSQLALNTAQVALLEKQKEGFLRDAEQKLAKIMTDTWNTSKTVEENTPVPGLLNNYNIDLVLDKAIRNIGVVPVWPT